MPDSSAQPPVPYQYFGNQFQMWRHDADVSREKIAKASSYSVATIQSIEQGRRPVPPKLAEIADELFGARGKLKAGLSFLRQEKFPERSRDFFEFEGDAITVWSYQPLLVPGLLQTEEYARALIGNHAPPLDDETVENRVEARLERQKLLAQKTPVDFSVVILEAVLRCQVGDLGVHKRQLLHLLEMARKRHISLQVLPFDRVTPAALNGSLVLLETKDHAHFGLTEGQSMSNLTSDPAELRLLTSRHGMIRTQALSVEESARFIERMVEGL